MRAVHYIALGALAVAAVAIQQSRPDRAAAPATTPVPTNHQRPSFPTTPAVTALPAHRESTLTTTNWRAEAPAELQPLLHPDQSYEQRWNAVRSLGRDLSAHQQTTLARYLADHTPIPAERIEQERFLKNHAMGLLQNQTTNLVNITADLIAISQDPLQDDGIRDYALQFLALWHGKAPDPHEVETGLWAATDDKHSTRAGTALLGLLHIAEDNQADTKQLREKALAVATDPAVSELSRIGAIQVCGRLKTPEIVPLAVELAQGDGSLPLRVAAVGTLGQVADATTRGVLENLARTAPPLMQPAIQTALRKMQ